MFERQIDPKLSHQIDLEKLYSKNQTISRIRTEFEDCKEFDFAKYMAQHNIPEDFGFDLLIQMVLHKRTTLPTLVGILRKHFEPAADASQLAADYILRSAEADLLNWNPTTRQLIIIFGISEDVQRDLDRFQFPLPMVVRPRTVRDNRDTGYVQTRNSIILRKNHHEDDVCLDVINRLNHIAFTINVDTAKTMKNVWANVDKPKKDEDRITFERRVRAYHKYNRCVVDAVEIMISHGNHFYFTHKVDKRGRVYCQGYQLNTQGNCYSKAILELADKELVE